MKIALTIIFSVGIIVICIFGLNILSKYKHTAINDTIVDYEDELIIIRLAQKNYSQDSQFAKAINRFNETNEHNIYVEIVELSNNAYQYDLNMLMTSKLGPDIMNIEAEWIPTYISKRWLLDLEEHIDDKFLEGYHDDFVEYLSGFTKNKQIFSFPTALTTYRFIYNKSVFMTYGLDPDKPPTTLEEMVEYSNIISKAGKRDNIYGFSLPLKNASEGFKIALEGPSTFSNIYYYDYGANARDFILYKPWFETIVRMNANRSVLPGSEALNTELALTQFEKGNIGMMYISSEHYKTLKNLYQNDYHWGVVLPPKYSKNITDEARPMVSYSNFYSINKSTLNAKEAIFVWKYLCSKEFLNELYTYGEVIPLNEEIRLNEKLAHKNPYFVHFFPYEHERYYPMVHPTSQEQHRVETYLRCLEFPAEMQDLLELESKYINTIDTRIDK